MKECLMVGDADQDTPLHLCAKQLLKCAKREFFSQTLEKMISKAEEMPGQTTKILDAVNKDGCTILHILSSSDSAIIQLRKALEAGADPEIRNKKGLSALEVAVNNGNNKSIKALREVTINKNERERKKKENPKYLDKDTFFCDSPLESPTSTEQELSDSSYEVRFSTPTSTKPSQRSKPSESQLHSSINSHTEKTDDVNVCAATEHNSSFSSGTTDNGDEGSAALTSEIPSSTRHGAKDSEVQAHLANEPPTPRRRGRPAKSHSLSAAQGSLLSQIPLNKPPKPKRRGRPPKSHSSISSNTHEADDFIGHATTSQKNSLSSDVVTSNDKNAAQGCHSSDEFHVSSTHGRGDGSVANNSNQDNAFVSFHTSQSQISAPTDHQADSSNIVESVNGTHSALSSNCPPVASNEVSKDDSNEGESYFGNEESHSHTPGNNEEQGSSARDMDSDGSIVTRHSDDRINNTMNGSVSAGDHSYSQMVNSDGMQAPNPYSDDSQHGHTTHPTNGNLVDLSNDLSKK